LLLNSAIIRRGLCAGGRLHKPSFCFFILWLIWSMLKRKLWLVNTLRVKGGEKKLVAQGVEGISEKITKLSVRLSNPMVHTVKVFCSLKVSQKTRYLTTLNTMTCISILLPAGEGWGGENKINYLYPPSSQPSPLREKEQALV